MSYPTIDDIMLLLSQTINQDQENTVCNSQEASQERVIIFSYLGEVGDQLGINISTTCLAYRLFDQYYANSQEQVSEKQNLALGCLLSAVKLNDILTQEVQDFMNGFEGVNQISESIQLEVANSKINCLIPQTYSMFDQRNDEKQIYQDMVIQYMMIDPAFQKCKLYDIFIISYWKCYDSYPDTFINNLKLLGVWENQQYQQLQEKLEVILEADLMLEEENRE